MITLSIETSCDDTSAALVDDSRNVLGMCTVSRIKDHAKFGGVVPEIASRHHEESILNVVSSLFESSNCTLSDVNFVSVTFSPGLVGSLLVGTSFAKGVSSALDIPLVMVDHIESHASSCLIENKDLCPPFLSLVISGGHTSIIDVEDYVKYKEYFHTLDDAVGEVLDKVARAMGIPYPGGPQIDKMALEGNPNTFNVPKPKISNFSFSGIKTWATNISREINEDRKNDLASSLLFGISEYVSEKVIDTALKLGRSKVALGGGVACSKVLRNVLSSKCKDNGLKLFVPSQKYCSDNAAMIGVQGIHNFKYSRGLYQCS